VLTILSSHDELLNLVINIKCGQARKTASTQNRHSSVGVEMDPGKMTDKLDNGEKP